MKGRNAMREMFRNQPVPVCLEGVGESSRARRLLLSLLYDTDDGVRWKAVEVLGAFAARQSTAALQPVRRVIRQLLWAMNDESGGLCRSGPEAIGEILARVPELVDEYTPMLISFIHEEPFEAGTLWALHRIGGRARHLAQDRQHEIMALALHPSPAIAGHALLLLGAWGIPLPRSVREKLADSPAAEFRFYDYASKTMQTRTVCGPARSSLSDAGDVKMTSGDRHGSRKEQG